MRKSANPGAMIALVLLHASVPAAAGPLYDMTPLLYAPHPFEARPTRQEKPLSRRGAAGRLYDMTPLLFAPHPFDVPAQRRQPGRTGTTVAGQGRQTN